MLRLSEGQTSTVQVGHMGMPAKKIKENILSLVEQLNNKFPGGEANIRTLSIKLPLSLSLPLYVTLRPNSSIRPPTLSKIRPKKHVVVEGELSTIPGATVAVTPDGTVRIINNKKKDISDSDMQSDTENNIEAEDVSDKNSESEDE
ncbi:Ribosomal L1 domain-containing protein CG13096 [Eumeta japonica]|uniref:Ribosomal L1 domain-containing protein CG13096 n=1 Tax=Eumeta variegata TaxID=151549 RepID=A0A4C1XV18_EUMVA|nr:Ribosomal L1 domain-containing protein CG13096 [Eumeta japonica]